MSRKPKLAKILNASACLFDANIWVALAFSTHPHFAEAKKEFESADSLRPVAFCRSTQQAFLRLITTPRLQEFYRSGLITNEEAWEKWEALLALPQVIWLDEPVGIDAIWRKYARLKTASPKVWMNAWLAAFAEGHGIRLVTLDRDFQTYEAQGLDLVLLTA